MACKGISHLATRSPGALRVSLNDRRFGCASAPSHRPAPRRERIEAFVDRGRGQATAAIAAERDAAQLTLGALLVMSTLIVEARECGPALEHVIHRLGNLEMAGELCTCAKTAQD
jgi:hypothetical protein